MINAYFTAEHHSFERVLDDVTWLGEKQSFVVATKRFGEFRIGLERHFAEGELLLLPLAKQYVDDPKAVDRLIAEHGQLRKLVDAAAAALAQWDGPRLAKVMDELRPAIAEHHRTEEKVVHPVLEEAIKSAAEWRKLLVRGRKAA